MRLGGGVGGGGRRTRGFKARQEKLYTPSLTALTFNIKGKPTKLGTLTGLGVRPII